MDLVKRSSSIGRLVVHISFKVKYCHRIFDNKAVAERCAEIFYEVAAEYRFAITDLGFDGDHVHFISDIGLYGIAQIAKALKGRSAKYLLREFSYLKKQYFWGSGLWGEQTYYDSIGQNYEELSNYVKSQGNTAGLRPADA